MNEIKIYGQIGRDVFASDVKAVLEQVDRSEELVVRIDSPGGSVFEGFSIYDALAGYNGRKRCVIESAAFSIAAMLPLAFERVDITENGYIMVHNPSLELTGDDEDLRRSADMVSKVKQNFIEAFSAKTGIPSDQVSELLRAETYYNADEAQAAGLVSTVIRRRSPSMVASIYTGIPAKVAACLRQTNTSEPASGVSTPVPKQSRQNMQAATIKEIREAFPKAKADFVLKCLEKEMPMTSVAAAAAEELMVENERLMAEIEELRAKLAEAMEGGEEMEAEPVAESGEDKPSMSDYEDDDEEMMPRMRGGKRPGSAPVTNVGGNGPRMSAKAAWDKAVEDAYAVTNDRPRAVIMANKKNPGLRQQMLQEISYNK